MLTAERLRELVSYDPETGVMRWRLRSRKTKPGVEVGSAHPCGYREARIGGHRCLLHRAIWLYVHGEWPSGQVDHINGNRTDNRIANLRDATVTEQLRNTALYSNNRCGVKGVCWHSQNRKWRARIVVNRKPICLGLYDTKEEAGAAYQIAAEKYFGEFASHLSRSSVASPSSPLNGDLR